MRILVTNDDGIESEGIVRLARLAAQYGEVWVIAPDSQRSGMSHMLTMRGSVELTKVDFPVYGVHAYSCSGSPADCVKIGILNIVPGRPDFVFSGINNSYNITADLQYSATAGAALEASFMKVKAIAFSEGSPDNHQVTDYYIKEITDRLMKEDPGRNAIWNVNFPACSLEECGGVLYNRNVSCDDFYIERYDVKEISEDTLAYTIDASRNWSGSEGTDLEAIINKCVSVGKVRNVS